MATPFDTTLKQLLDAFAADWIGWLAPRLDLPADATASPFNADLSLVQLSADRVFRLNPPADGLLHVEPQASHDTDLVQRLHEYNVLLHRYADQVYSVVLLLRREANSPSLTGMLRRRYGGGRLYDTFRYFVVRVWELPVEALLAGGVGTLPLALLTDEAEPRLGELVDRIDTRLRTDGTPDDTRRLVLTSGYILLGLRYDDVQIQSAFVRARGMKESTTYQAILREGRQEGRQEGEREGRLEGMREAILDILAERFGVVPPEVTVRVQNETDLIRLRNTHRAALTVASPDVLLR